MIKTPLRDYQKEAVSRAVSALTGGGGFGLWCEQRTGKTLSALAVTDRIKPDWLIVVCPKTAIQEWVKQIDQHLKVDWPFKATVVNYEAVCGNRKSWYKWVKDCRKAGVKTLLIADESHYIKRRGASRSRVIRHLARDCTYRLALTGTPIAQGPQDAWAQFDFIDPSVFETWEEFENRYLVRGGFRNKQIVGSRNDKEFNRRFHQYSFRITLREAKKEEGLTLSVKFQKEYVDLDQKSRGFYDELLKELITVVNEKKIRVKNVLSATTKCQQVTGGAILDEDKVPHIVGHEKIEHLHKVIRSLRSRSKFIVVCRFIHEIDRVKRFLERQGYSVAVVRGGEPFSGKFDTDAIVMQIQSGIARDMSAADCIIFYSTDYSYLNFEQSRSRILAYNKSFAKYVFLLARDTVDLIIYEAITRKKNLANLICDHYRKRGTQ